MYVTAIEDPPINGQYADNPHIIAGVQNKDGGIFISSYESLINDGVNVLPKDGGGHWVRVRTEYEQTNIKNFGVVGDGVADDTVAIQAVFDTLTTFGGGEIHFPKGRYKITSAITVTNKYFFKISGIGEASIISNENNTSSFIFTDCQRFNIDNIKIEGSGTTHGVGSIQLHGIEFINSHNGRITSLFVFGHGGHGIYCHGNSWLLSFINCRLQNNKFDGINSVTLDGLNQNGNSFSFINCTLVANGLNGITWKASSLNITGCDFEGNKEAGLLMSTEGTAISGWGAAVTGCYFEGNKQGNIRLKTTGVFALCNITLDGNYFNSNGYEIGEGSPANIVAEGWSLSVRGLVINSSNYISTEGSFVKQIDLGGTCDSTCVISAESLSTSENFGHAEVKLPIKTLVLSGLFNQTGLPFTSIGKSDNFFDQPVKKGDFMIPLIDLSYLYRLKFLVETNTSSSYTITSRLFRLSLTSSGSEVGSVSKSQLVSSGGNFLYDWFFDEYINFRLVKDEVTFIRVEITNPATGTIMTIKDLILEYI